VERPASVVKELVENALDAEAKAVSVELRQGGLGLIRVSDDGQGMGREDARLAPQRFTTSKITTAADLAAIRSLGFRGEALSSITAVGQLEILTRQLEEVEGTRVRVTGDRIETEPAASPSGSQVTVTGLFATTPARRKFLKSPRRETELVQRTVARYALAYPHVAFRFSGDGRERLALPPGSALERVGAVLGREVAGEMLELAWEALDLRVRGFISRPSLARSRREGQYFFVNGRPVRAGLLAVMLERPYAGLLPPGSYPLAVIHLEISPAFVDVNVHPQKAEVRFSQERSVYGAVSRAVTAALQDFPRLAVAGAADFVWPFASLGSPPSLHETGADYDTGELQPLAQLQQTYILAQSPAGLVIVDQHAAHEQILYQSLAVSPERQPLVPAAQLQLTARDSELLAASLPIFSALGFEIEPFGGHSFLVRTLPASLSPHLANQVSFHHRPDAGFLVTTLLTELQQLGTRSVRDDEERLDRLAQKAACASAIKAGDPLNDAQMRQLLAELALAWSPAVCPHGRPAFVTVPMEELERRFGRR
jgi:DNA mismatch repair protein MutL